MKTTTTYCITKKVGGNLMEPYWGPLLVPLNIFDKLRSCSLSDNMIFSHLGFDRVSAALQDATQNEPAESKC